MGNVGLKKKNGKKEAGLVENKKKMFPPSALPYILVMSNKNIFMIVYSTSNWKKKGKKYDCSNKR